MARTFEEIDISNSREISQYLLDRAVLNVITGELLVPHNDYSREGAPVTGVDIYHLDLMDRKQMREGLHSTAYLEWPRGPESIGAWAHFELKQDGFVPVPNGEGMNEQAQEQLAAWNELVERVRTEPGWGSDTHERLYDAAVGRERESERQLADVRNKNQRYLREEKEAKAELVDYVKEHVVDDARRIVVDHANVFPASGYINIVDEYEAVLVRIDTDEPIRNARLRELTDRVFDATWTMNAGLVVADWALQHPDRLVNMDKAFGGVNMYVDGQELFVSGSWSGKPWDMAHEAENVTKRLGGTMTEDQILASLMARDLLPEMENRAEHVAAGQAAGLYPVNQDVAISSDGMDYEAVPVFFDEGSETIGVLVDGRYEVLSEDQKYFGNYPIAWVDPQTRELIATDELYIDSEAWAEKVEQQRAESVRDVLAGTVSDALNQNVPTPDTPQARQAMSAPSQQQSRSIQK